MNESRILFSYVEKMEHRKNKKWIVARRILLMLAVPVLIAGLFLKNNPTSTNQNTLESSKRREIIHTKKFQNIDGVLLDDSEDALWRDYYGSGDIWLDTEVVKNGSNSFAFRLPEDGGTVGIKKDIEYNNWQGASFRLFVRSDNWQALDAVRILVSTKGDFDEYYIINLANHTVSPSNDQWLEFVISTSDFINWNSHADWKYANAVVMNASAKKGETAQVWFNDFRILPPSHKKGVITITFDDGWRSVSKNAFPIMEEYGFRGVAYIIPETLGSFSPVYMSKRDIVELSDSGWDISGHNMEALNYGKSKEEMESVVADSASFLNEKNFSGSEHYAYPFGIYNDTIVQSVEKNFSTGRTVNNLAQPQNYISLYGINNYQILKNSELEDIFRIIDMAMDNKDWCILTFHHVVHEPQNDMEFSRDKFRKVLEYIKESEIQVVTMSDYFGA